MNKIDGQMAIPSFIIPFEFHKEIHFIEEIDTGFTIKYEDQQSINVQCDIMYRDLIMN
jgi:hypothetical protein